MDESEMFFEKDGQTYVRVNIVDDNDPNLSTTADIPQEYYEKIQSGETSINKYLDEDGKVAFMLVDNQPEDDVSDSINTLNKVITNTTNFHTIDQSSSNDVSKRNKDINKGFQSNSTNIDSNERQKPRGETYYITQIPDTGDFFRVTLTNERNEVIDSKMGRLDQSVDLNLLGTIVSYEITGILEDGVYPQTTLYVDPSDNEKDGETDDVAGVSLTQSNQIMAIDSRNEGLASDMNRDGIEEFVITEDSVTVDGYPRQMAILTDKLGNELDRKVGDKGDLIKLTITDKAFEYLIQGPSENNEPIVTSFEVNKNDDIIDGNTSSQAEPNIDPAESWCPPELSKEEYATIREQARLVAKALENAGDLPSIQPYSEQLGSKIAYDDIRELVERYKSRAEERRTDLTSLRKHSKLYIPMKASARRLTHVEWATNEAAAQVCRYIPALLFHKRKLFEYAATVIENTGLFPNESLRQSDARDDSDVDNRSYGAALATMDESQPTSANIRNYPQASMINDNNNYMNTEISNNNMFGQNFHNFNKRESQFEFQLTNSEELAIKNAAERLQEELYQYPVKPTSECKQIELQIRDEIPRLKSMLEGTQSDIEQAHEYIRETSAVNGRLLPSQRARAQPLSPYDVAVNEAAYHLVKNNIGLLTYRKVLGDLAKKVIRASGCSFRHTTMGDKNFRDYNTTNLWLYNQENIPELDLSPAIKVLNDSLENGPLHSIIGSTFVPVIDEPLVLEGEEDDDEEIYRPTDFLQKEVLGDTTFYCEADNNVLNENAIFCHTGTDDLKKVRILDFQNFSFTSILPMDINFCYNLVELNLFNNYISYLPRCLFLPNLTKLNLRKNRFVTVPLLEQFPKLYSVEVDERIVRKFNKQSLTFFCQDLCYINNKKFSGYISDEFNTTLLDAKTSIESMVQSRWEEDLAMYFKKGVTKSECQKVIETLVLSVRERKLYNEKQFFSYKDLIARKVAESFLDSKIIDDDEEEEVRDRNNEEAEDDDEEDEDKECYKVPHIRYQKKNEFDNQSVEKGQILLQDEPMDRLTNVVGQALRSGKTVVYSVMRTAARQPGGDLIPVGGCDSSQNNNNSYLMPKKSVDTTNTSELNEKSLSGSALKTKPGPASFKKRVYGLTQSENEETDDECTNESVEYVIITVNCMADEYFDKRKIGRPKKSLSNYPTPSNNKENLEKQKNNLFKLPRTLTTESTGISNYASDDHDAFSDSKTKQTGKEIMNQETFKKIGQIVRECTSPIPPSKLREMLGITSRGRHPRFIKEASDRTYIKHNQAIPDTNANKKISYMNEMIDIMPPTVPLPERPPPVNKTFNTRDSNRLKRFNPYGVDGVADSTWLDVDDDTAYDIMSSEAKHIPTAIHTANTSIIGNKRERADDDYEYQPTPKASRSESISSPTKSELNGSEASFVQEIVRKKITGQPTDRGVHVNLPYSSIFHPPDLSNIKGLTSIGIANNHVVADYDPLHFIRCHARDNDPRDCLTKVWRCAFEPNKNDPYSQTTHVVATCGGECVCLIDCKTGKVMKRFKSRDEEFYSVAWTTLEVAEGHHINILAAAGKSRHIRLLHPEHLVCYSEIRATSEHHHQHEIACLVFHPRRPTILFSGDAMASIIVWDIGPIPTAPNFHSEYQMLLTLVCPRSHLNPVLNLVVMPAYNALIAGCEDGVFVWTFPEFKKYKPEETRSPDFEVKVPTHQEPCFDGLARLSENMFLVKCVEEGEIFSINFGQLIHHYKARKFDDHNRVVADIMVRLRWQITDEIYINVSAQNRLGSVACGDNEGTIWLYDMAKQLTEDTASLGNINKAPNEAGTIIKKANIKPIKLLDWPECSVESNQTNPNNTEDNSIPNANKNPVINCVEMSSDGQYLVAVTDNNLVCIWSIPV